MAQPASRLPARNASATTRRLLPMSWKLTNISETFPGSDGHVRIVTVKTSSGQFKRPIHKLVALPSKEYRNLKLY